MCVHLILPALILLALGACSVKPLQVRPPEELTAAVPLPVSGRLGWQRGRELRFGAYSTSPTNGATVRTRTTACPDGCSRVDLGAYKARFDEALSESKSRLTFTLIAPDGTRVQVQAVGEMNQRRREWITRWFGLPTLVEAEATRSINFIGTIEPDAAGLSAWRFVVWESDDGIAPGARQGWAEDGQGRRITLHSLKRWEGSEARGVKLPLHGLHLGYAFELDGRVLGAVDTMTEGTVWMRHDLDLDLRLALAGMASALLLHTDLGGQPPPTLRR